jgi:hypothetical protein
MLTCTEEIYKGSFGFRAFGTDRQPRQVSEYMIKTFESQRNLDKLTAVLRAIDTRPLTYSHPQKFKRLEKGVWEIKIGQIRLACVWDPKPINLIAIYGFNKKVDRWPRQHLVNMRQQKDLYFEQREKSIEGEYYGRTGRIAEQSQDPS